MRNRLFLQKEPPKCEFSSCRRYRYTLWRRWAIEDLARFERSAETKAHEYLMVIGLNPSTADDTQNDPTIRRCIQFAKDWGFGGLCMTNIFAWRDTDPRKMKAALQPEGETVGMSAANDIWLQRIADDAGLILGAWGTHGTYLDRASRVVDMLPPMRCLGVTKNGQPKHPLYIKASTAPIPYRP